MTRRSAAAPYTSVDLFRDVLDGCLVSSPAPSRVHQRVVARLARLLVARVPEHVEVLCHQVMALPNGDGPVPDLLLATVEDAPGDGTDADAAAVAAGAVPTVIEVVNGASGHRDRVRKRELYAAAGVGCFWRVELDPWSGYRGPLPVVFVRVRDGNGWRESFAPAGALHRVPVAVGQHPDGTLETIEVTFDPGQLPLRRWIHRLGRLPGESPPAG